MIEHTQLYNYNRNNVYELQTGAYAIESIYLVCQASKIKFLTNEKIKLESEREYKARHKRVEYCIIDHRFSVILSIDRCNT